MSAAKGREEVVERVVVCDVYRRKIEVSLEAIGMEQVALAERNIKETSRSDTRRIVIVVTCPGRWNAKQGGGVFRSRADRWKWISRCGFLSSAHQPRLKLFVGSEAAQVYCGLTVQRGYRLGVGGSRLGVFGGCRQGQR